MSGDGIGGAGALPGRGYLCAEEAGWGWEGSWVSRAQADALIGILCWKKNICKAAGGGAGLEWDSVPAG